MKKSVLALALGLALSGCATIMGSPTQTVPIGSTPSEARIVVTDEADVEVFAGLTPASVTLNKSTGSYWGGKRFKVTISKEGYKTQVIPVESRANGWYIAGNLLFGGLIGWFIVDPLNGGMYTLSPDAIASTLDAGAAAHNNRSGDGSISIVLLQDVPAELRAAMVRVR